MKKKNESILAVILAKIGSKRLKKKEIKHINNFDKFKENSSIIDLLFNYSVDSRNFVISFKNKFIQ